MSWKKAEKIEHLEREFNQKSDKPWKNKSHSRKWLKKVRNKKARLTNKFEKPIMKNYDGWEY
jgi:hypothetical protein